jgi:uncharacterized protein YxjI
MSVFEITQRFMTIASEYEVKVGTETEASLMVKGTFLTSTPNLTLFEKDKAIATLTGNMMKTKFVISAGGEEKAVVNFPAVSLRKTMTLTVNGRGYHATSGGLSTEIFQCADNEGKVALELRKEVSFRDRFKVDAQESIPREVAILAAVAIHCRYYE